MAARYLFLWILSAFFQLPEGKLNRTPNMKIVERQICNKNIIMVLHKVSCSFVKDVNDFS